MKRYRVLSFDFDSRPLTLASEIQENWRPEVKQQHQQNKTRIEEGFAHEYGHDSAENKLKNIIDLGNKPFSILAFHNQFFEQVRDAFIVGAFYPALTGVCALGERILNYLILVLREDHRPTPEYKAVYRKDSFDNWDIPINTLESWDVLLPEVAAQFRCLQTMRQKAIHFRPEVDQNTRELALEAIRCLGKIIGSQFSAFGTQPWFITAIPGEIYIKKEWESRPFIRRIYLPNCAFVGYKHRIVTMLPRVTVDDNYEYEHREITDEEFGSLRRQQK